MRFIAFPSVEQKKIINLHIICFNDNWRIVAGPTPSGLYLLEGSKEVIDILQEAIYGYYIIMEDF